MDIETLQGMVNRPDVHRTLVSDYTGPYSLGVGQDRTTKQPILVLQVPDASVQHFPSQIKLRGEIVPVVVRSGFRPPVPLRQAAG
jgi:hypothetical protein